MSVKQAMADARQHVLTLMAPSNAPVMLVSLWQQIISTVKVRVKISHAEGIARIARCIYRCERVCNEQWRVWADVY